MRACTRSRWLGNRDGGQAIVEFALIAPIIFLFLFVIVDFGIAMDRRIVLQDAVREGARYAAVTDDLDLIKERTVAQAQSVISKNDVIVCYMDPETNTLKTNPDVGDAVDVCEKNFSYDPFMIRGGPFGITVPQIDMFLTGSARLEQKPTASSDSRCPCP
jgi:Flp pilus assembly protein TadG